MRTITIRQFQQHLFKELEELPLVITRKGKPSIVVTMFDKKVATSPKVTTIKEFSPGSKIDSDFQCKHGVALDQRCVACALGE